MSTIIDINVTPTIQEVTINTVDNITVINVNTQSGGGGIESVTGTAVDNTDPDNPVIDISTLQEVMETGTSYSQIVGDYQYLFNFNTDTMELFLQNNDLDLYQLLRFQDEILLTFTDFSNGKSTQLSLTDGGGGLSTNSTTFGVNSLLVPIRTSGSGFANFFIPNNKPAGNYTLATTDDIPTIDATPTDGSSNAVSSNGVFDALALRKKVIVKDVTSATVTGTTSLTLAKTYEVTAGTLSAGGFLDLFMYASRTGASNSYTMAIYINTTNNFGTATLITSIATAGNFSPFLPFKAQYVLKNNLLIGGISSQTAGSNYVNSISQVSVACNNTSNSVWLFIGITPTNSGSSIVVEGVEILN